MTEKTEALRLADSLRDGVPYDEAKIENELRRLHEAHDWQYRMAGERLRRVEKLEAQRDALLKALKGMLLHMGMDEDEWNKPTFDHARAAIKAVEGGSMTDREYLELAAKAAGLGSHRYCEPWSAMAAYTLYDGYHGPSWNPLTNDGDALRLAVKLHLPVEAMIAFVAEREPDWDKDPYAATRRAIVRAAAEIGRSMK